ncbi:hypothetical protein PanWU01x14_343950 [Parasponia andersonii]|uniref:Uncharacterized protein n=1 Tax=Parasponia andersonii TaxID=3476 RepID=A0A2P5AD99_PARAD|nr:hypothetical protein PanWU01x14_343950 [Parasponia andersonii]
MGSLNLGVVDFVVEYHKDHGLIGAIEWSLNLGVVDFVVEYHKDHGLIGAVEWKLIRQSIVLKIGHWITIEN